MFIKISLTLFSVLVITTGYPQTIQRIDGSEIVADSLTSKIRFLMKVANVSGVAVSVFNDNKAVFSNTFGLANVPRNIPLQQSSVMYGASFSKTVFAYIAMQFVQEKIIDLDKPLVEYLTKALPDYEI